MVSRDTSGAAQSQPDLWHLSRGDGEKIENAMMQAVWVKGGRFHRNTEKMQIDLTKATIDEDDIRTMQDVIHLIILLRLLR